MNRIGKKRLQSKVFLPATIDTKPSPEYDDDMDTGVTFESKRERGGHINLSPVMPLFVQNSKIIAVYALGSVVRGELRRESDIDLALLLAPGATLSSAELVALSVQLAEILGRPVDLGLLSTRNLVYLRQAVLTGQRIYCRPFTQAALLVANGLGLYANFQDERREVMNAYTAG